MRTAQRSHVESDRPVARSIGSRVRAERKRAGLTQAALAEGRYTKAYISALENGLAKPSVAALHYLAGRLGVPVTRLLEEPDAKWSRLEADLLLASGEWQAAAHAYQALAAEATPPARAEILVGLAEAYCRLDLAAEAVQAASEATSLFRTEGRDADAARARYWQAFGLYLLEQGDQALDVLVGVLHEMQRGLPVEPDLNVRILIALAMVASRDDEPERALAWLEQARAITGDLDDRRRATFLFSLALSYRELGDFEAALTTGTQSLGYFRAVDAEREVGSLENELALVFLATGQIDRARQHADAAYSIFATLEDDRLLAHAAETGAQIELAAGDPIGAADRAHEALRYAAATDNRKAAISASLTLARARRRQGDEKGASAILARAAELAREHSRRGQLQAVLTEWAQVLAAQGDLGRAYELSQEALGAGRGRPVPQRASPDRIAPD
jgi:transcriptional regulator with XRE-family HTH domain